MKFALAIICGILLLSFKDKEPLIKNLKVVAKKGQGAYSLLRNYQLLDNQQNLEEFYNLNNIKHGSVLEKGKSYLLPIRMIKFDGNNIRSTLDLSDYNKAKEIQIYNEAMVSSGLKNKPYTKDNILWLPSHLDKQNKTISTSTKKQNINAINSSPIPSEKLELISDNKLDENEIKEIAMKDPKKEDSHAPETSFVKKVSNKMLNIKLFGDKEEIVPIESEELKDHVFYIVPGHGGPDPGAMYKDKDSDFTYCEDEYAYDVSLRLARNLMTKAATVYVIVQDKNDGIRDAEYLECDNDEVCIGDHEMPRNQLSRLRQGMIKTNQLYFKHQLEGIKNQYMISIHIDSQDEDNRQDVYFYYQSESKASKKKAKKLKSVFSDKYREKQGRAYKGSISARPLYVMRTSEADPIFIELANIQNAQDRKRITSPRNRQFLADWIMEAFL